MYQYCRNRLFFFYESKCKGLKTPKNAVRKPNEAGKSSNQSNYEPYYPQTDDYWVENELEREISKGLQCSRKLKYIGLGWRRSPRALKTCFLNSTMIICLNFARSTAKLGRFTTIQKVIALVEGFPGFVGISNRDFREFAFFIQKKLKMIRSIIEICPTPLWKC